MPHFQVTRTDGPGDGDPPIEVSNIHLEIMAYRRAGRRLLHAADLLEAELARKGIASTEEAQAEAIVRVLVETVDRRDDGLDDLARIVRDFDPLN